MKQNLDKLNLTKTLLSFISTKYLSIIGKKQSITTRFLFLTDKYLTFIQHTSQCEGWRQALKLGKEHRAQYLGLIQGKEIVPVPFRKNKNGALILSYHFWQLSKECPHLQRLSLTVLSVTRLFILEPKIDLSSIQDPFKGSEGALLKVLSLLRKKTPAILKKRSAPSWDGQIWYSNKSGPQGPSGYTAHIDASNLLKPNNQRHFSLLCTLAHELGCDVLLEQCIKLSTRVTKDGPIGRLHLLPDKEGKTRNIFIGDYYTQSVFRILHKDLMEILRAIPEDYTFNQDSSSDTIRRWIEEGNVINGFDLSNATERFPLLLQGEVIEQVYGTKIKESWLGILQVLKFDFNTLHDVKFAVGQPMGYYTSWPAFSLTHHAIIHLAAYNAGVSPHDSYCLVGDDVVIKGTRLSKAYLQLLEDIGVEVNLFKSTSYTPTGGCVEFLKRLYTVDQEITPFPLGTFLASYHTVASVLTLQELLHRSRWPEDLLHSLVDKLPITKKWSALIGAPIMKWEEPSLTTEFKPIQFGLPQMGEKAVPQLRYAGGVKGDLWSQFEDHSIRAALMMAAAEINEKVLRDFKSYAETNLNDIDSFVQSLQEVPRFRWISMNVQILGYPPETDFYQECHPVLIALYESWLRQKQEEKSVKLNPFGMDLPTLAHKRITSLSRDRFLPERSLAAKSWAKILLRAIHLLKENTKV